MKKLNNGVVPPVPTFHFERIRIAKEGNNHHDTALLSTVRIPGVKSII